MPTSADPKAESRRLGLDLLFHEARENESTTTKTEPVKGATNYPAGWTTGEPYPIEWRDLVRLYAVLRYRRVTTVLEFGCGYSTAIIARALEMNELEFGDNVRSSLRRSAPFRVFVVDGLPQYIDITRRRLSDDANSRVNFLQSDIRMTTFLGRICTEYALLPNVVPDFIYLDGPDQHEVQGDVNGISTRNFDRWPLACDILKIEHLLLPGTLVVSDGRTANVRFLLANFQRKWRHEHDVDGDVHFLELIDEPLGQWNQRHVEFCLGPGWQDRPLIPDSSQIAR